MPGGVLDDMRRAGYPEFGHYVFTGIAVFPCYPLRSPLRTTARAQP